MFLRTAHILFVALLCAVGFTYGSYTGGAATRTTDGPFYCNELHSSGGDDTAVIGFAFVLFSLSLLIRLFRFFKSVSRFEVGVHTVSLLAAIGILFIASLDCAQIFYTAFGVPDLHLAAALLSLPISLALLIGIRMTS